MIEAFDALVRVGVSLLAYRYAGLQFAKPSFIRNWGLSKFVSVQNIISIWREDERELIPLGRPRGVLG